MGLRPCAEKLLGQSLSRKNLSGNGPTSLDYTSAGVYSIYLGGGERSIQILFGTESFVFQFDIQKFKDQDI